MKLVNYNVQILAATALAVAAMYAVVGCKADEIDTRSSLNLSGGDGGSNSNPASPTPKPSSEPIEPLNLLSENEAMDFFRDNCRGCHGVDDNGEKASNFSSWGMTEDELTQNAMEISFFAPIVYQALANKLSEKPPKFPVAMPFGGGHATGESRRQILEVLAWFQINLPLVVAEAEDTYGVSVDSEIDTNIEFECVAPVTNRVFLHRLTNTLFDRPPTDDELALIPEEQWDSEVTAEVRAQLVKRVWENEAWLGKFEEVGLLKLARAIGGAPALSPVGDLDPNTISDLKSEFYRMTMAGYDSQDYQSMFSADYVYVTDRTASLYNCDYTTLEPIEGDTLWRKCDLQAPRSGFFTTIGYLASRPQSFLKESNNYGRVATMYFTLAGEGFRAAANGPAGSDEVSPLPDCLEKDDNRRVTGAARGSAAVPEHGQICQGCHISRNLAPGSVLFRDYAPDGRVYTADNLAEISPDLLEEATTDEWTFRDLDTGDSKQVDEDYLKHLLSAEKKACSVSLNPANPPSIHQDVGDLASHLMSNKKRLARGFMKHAHRAFLNSESVNFDLIYTAVRSVDENGSATIKDLVGLYLGSETFACSPK